MIAFFNPLTDPAPKAEKIESTSSLMNETLGMCPKCQQPSGSAIVNGDTIYYCERCRVSQPTKQ